jgi:hypothetical protein
MKLSYSQKEILSLFVQQFCRQTDGIRKSACSELGYVYMSLLSIFKDRFGFHINREDVFEAFCNLNYPMVFAEGLLTDELQSLPLMKCKEVSDISGKLIYVGVNPDEIKFLRKYAIKLPSVNKHDVMVKALVLQDEIDRFQLQLPEYLYRASDYKSNSTKKKNAFSKLLY